MTCLNKLFLNYMQINGFTCGLDDLILNKKADKVRKEMLENVHEETVAEICTTYGEPIPKNIHYMGRSDYTCDREGELIFEDRREHV